MTRGRGISRRGFLEVTAAAGGAMLLGFHLPGCGTHTLRRREMAEHADRTGEFVPNAWIKITGDNRLVFTLDRVEMGQGTMTSHAQMVAEELEVDPAAIEVVFARAGREYNNSKLFLQVTGGSTSVVSSWRPLREAAATAREMLREAAAIHWKVPKSECAAGLDGNHGGGGGGEDADIGGSGGAIVHTPTRRRIAYGALTHLAAYLEIPSPSPKPRDEWKVLGVPVPRVDARMKVDGTGTFGIDVRMPDMLNATVIHPPVLGGKPRAVRADAALARPGVRHVFAIPSGGVAVVADRYWQAQRAAEAVEVDWDEGALAGFDSEEYRRALARRAESPGARVRGDGDVGRAFAGASKTIEAVYEAPYLAHATMEPMNCAAHVTADACRIWGPTQIPDLAREVAVQITGFDHRDVTVENTLLGGGFGRRLAADYVAEAVWIAKRVGAPVKLLWSRESDTKNDYFRPQTYHALRGGIDAEGRPVAWFHRIVGQSILSVTTADWLSVILPGWVPRVSKLMLGDAAERFIANGVVTDQTSVEGAATLPYAIPNLAVEYAEEDPGVPIGFWRSVGHSANAFVVESFIDELAHAAGADPYQLRRGLLERAPRQRGVLDLAASKAGWGKPPPAGRFRGICQHASFDSYCAQVAEVSVNDGEVAIHRVVCAIDCGTVVNPDIVAAQMESAIVFGLSAALTQEITFARGRVQQSNFNDYRMLRMHETPQIEVHIVPSELPPTGVGEPGLPPIAPAVCNAIFAATGVRIRRLPISHAAEALAAASAKGAK